MGYAVLFDLDGVLVNSSECELEAWGKVFDEFGVEFDPDLYYEFTGSDAYDVVRKYIKPDATRQEALDAKERKSNYALTCQRSHGVHVVTPSIQLASDLKDQGFELAVVTGASKERAEEVLNIIDFNKYISSLVTANDDIAGKPSPEPFLKAANDLGVPPENCLVIEDGASGVSGATEAGMKTIGVATTNTKEALSEATLVLSHPRNITVDKIKDILKADT